MGRTAPSAAPATPAWVHQVGVDPVGGKIATPWCPCSAEPGADRAILPADRTSPGSDRESSRQFSPSIVREGESSRQLSLTGATRLAREPQLCHQRASHPLGEPNPSPQAPDLPRFV